MIAHESALLDLNLGAGSFYLLSHPAHIEHVLSVRADNYVKGRIFNRLRPILGGGLLLSEGEAWRSERRLLQPAFHPRRIRALVPLFGALLDERLARWDDAARRASALELGAEMRTLTMRIGVAALFSREVSEAQSDAIAEGFDRALHYMPLRFFTYFLPEWVPLPGQRAIRRARCPVEAFAAAILDERKEKPGPEDDLLSLLMARVDEAPRTREPGAVRAYLMDHITTTLFGGYESTATSLTWVFLLLARHPDVCARVEEEIDSLLGDRLPTYDDLTRLHYLQQVIDESLRLFPPFWSSFRTALADDDVGGVKLPAGASLLISPYVTQRDPRFFPDPARFDPERFADTAPLRPKFSYFPFLDGPRACIGKQFAQVVMKLVVARTLQRYRLSLPADYVLDTVARGTVRPRSTPWVRVRPRT